MWLCLWSGHEQCLIIITSTLKKIMAEKMATADSNVNQTFHMRLSDLSEHFSSLARCGNYERIANLLQNKRTYIVIDIDVKDKKTGNTPLIWAAKRNHAEVVQLLVLHGADVTLMNNTGLTALHVASQSIRFIILESVGRRTEASQQLLLLHASWQADIKGLLRVLSQEKVTDINCKNADGYTPIMLAVRDIELFERLALQTSRPYNPTEVVAELINARADLLVKDNDGKSCLHHACSSKAMIAQAVRSTLIANGANLGIAENIEAQPERGSEVNSRGFDDATALHSTPYSKHESETSVLLEHCADLEKTQNMHKTLQQASGETKTAKRTRHLRAKKSFSKEDLRKSVEDFSKQKNKGKTLSEELQSYLFTNSSKKESIANHKEPTEQLRFKYSSSRADRDSQTLEGDGVQTSGQVRNKQKSNPRPGMISCSTEHSPTIGFEKHMKAPGMFYKNDRARRSYEDRKASGRSAPLSTQESVACNHAYNMLDSLTTCGPTTMPSVNHRGSESEPIRGTSNQLKTATDCKPYMKSQRRGGNTGNQGGLGRSNSATSRSVIDTISNHEYKPKSSQFDGKLVPLTRTCTSASILRIETCTPMSISSQRTDSRLLNNDPKALNKQHSLNCSSGKKEVDSKTFARDGLQRQGKVGNKPRQNPLTHKKVCRTERVPIMNPARHGLNRQLESPSLSDKSSKAGLSCEDHKARGRRAPLSTRGGFAGNHANDMIDPSTIRGPTTMPIVNHRRSESHPNRDTPNLLKIAAECEPYTLSKRRDSKALNKQHSLNCSSGRKEDDSETFTRDGLQRQGKVGNKPRQNPLTHKKACRTERVPIMNPARHGLNRQLESPSLSDKSSKAGISCEDHKARGRRAPLSTRGGFAGNHAYDILDTLTTRGPKTMQSVNHRRSESHPNRDTPNLLKIAAECEPFTLSKRRGRSNSATSRSVIDTISNHEYKPKSSQFDGKVVPLTRTCTSASILRIKTCTPMSISSHRNDSRMLNNDSKALNKQHSLNCSSGRKEDDSETFTRGGLQRQGNVGNKPRQNPLTHKIACRTERVPIMNPHRHGLNRQLESPSLSDKSSKAGISCEDHKARGSRAPLSTRGDVAGNHANDMLHPLTTRGPKTMQSVNHRRSESLPNRNTPTNLLKIATECEPFTLSKRRDRKVLTKQCSKDSPGSGGFYNSQTLDSRDRSNKLVQVTNTQKPNPRQRTKSCSSVECLQITNLARQGPERHMESAGNFKAWQSYADLKARGRRAPLSIREGVSGSLSYSSERPNYGNLKKKCDDSLTQTMLDSYRQTMNSVGAIMYSGSVLGTGFRVGTKMIATAWHIISEIIDPRRSCKRIYNNLSLVCIIFGFSPTDPSATKFFLAPTIHYKNEYLDIAILELSDTNGTFPNKLSLRKEPLVPADAKTVSVMGYGHPRNPNKIFDSICPVVQSDSLEIQAAKMKMKNNKANLKLGLLNGVSFSVVDNGYRDYDAPHKLLLHSVMEHGASGAPILACVNPLVGIVEVVGVFTHALPEVYFNLKEEFKFLIPHDCRFEAGSRMEHIYKDMRKLPIGNKLKYDLFSI